MTPRARTYDLDLDAARQRDWDTRLARLEADLQREADLSDGPLRVPRHTERILCSTCDRVLWAVEYPRPGQTHTAHGTARCRACTARDALDLAERRSDPPEPALRHQRWEAPRPEPASARWMRALGLLLCCVSAMITLGLAWYALEGWLR